MATMYTEEERMHHISACKESGLTQKEYAEQHGVKYQTLCRWILRSMKRSKIKPEKPKVFSPKNFIPIRVTENTAPSKSMTKVEIEFPDGTKLRIH